MGYHLTLLRTADGKQTPILLEEAVNAVLTVQGWAYTPLPSPTFTFTNSKGSKSLWYGDGELWTKFQGEEWILEPLLDLAKILDARVRGDELETYETTGKTYFHSDDVILNNHSAAVSAELIKKHVQDQRRIRNIIIGFFIVLGFIAFLIGKQFETN